MLGSHKGLRETREGPYATTTRQGSLTWLTLMTGSTILRRGSVTVTDNDDIVDNTKTGVIDDTDRIDNDGRVNDNETGVIDNGNHIDDEKRPERGEDIHDGRAGRTTSKK
eukprot:4476068-Amphidinium_carterae.1